MSGKYKGVKSRLLQLNSRAFHVPCSAHTLNLVVADGARASTVAVSYFGLIQRIYTFMSASTHRWEIVKKHVQIVPKLWSDTRWESHVQAVQVVRYESGAIYEALLEIADVTNDAMAKSEANSLAKEVDSYQFLISSVVWYDILNTIYVTSTL